jgi:hypothetical protein
MSRFYFLLFTFLVVSCSPPEVQVQTNSAQIQSASPTDTTLINTPTASSTNTPLPQTPTAAPSRPSSQTNTPTQESASDIRIIIGEPQEYLPGNEEMSYRYWNPGVSSWDSPITNDEILDLLGEEEGIKYLEITDRILGHKRCFLRRTGNIYLPEIICFRLIFYGTYEGASLALSPDWDPLDLYEDEILIEGLTTVGEESYITYAEHHIGEEEYDINYTVRFRIRNVQAGVNIWGRKGFIEIQYLINLAKILESNFLYAPIINP